MTAEGAVGGYEGRRAQAEAGAGKPARHRHPAEAGIHNRGGTPVGIVSGSAFPPARERQYRGSGLQPAALPDRLPGRG
jgi:hypothetical protein